jgi:hypothetical protein
LLQQTLRCETALDGGSQLAHAKRLSVLPLGERLGHLAKSFDEVRDAERLARQSKGVTTMTDVLAPVVPRIIVRRNIA